MSLVAQTPPPTKSPAGISPKVLGPGLAKCLQGAGGPPRGRQSHTLIAERGGGLDVHAYGHTHVHTYALGSPRAPLHAHSPRTRPPSPGRPPAQQSTGTPSVEKIMPVVGS